MGYSIESVVTFAPGVTLSVALQVGVSPDPDLTAGFVAHTHPDLDLVAAGRVPLDDGLDTSHTNDVHAAVWPGISILSSPHLPVADHPSQLDLTRVTHPAAGRGVLAVYSVDGVGAGGFALWDPAGQLLRALSIEGSPRSHRLHEAHGDPLPEEQPWWDDPDAYPPTLVKLVMLTRVGFDVDHEGPALAPIDTTRVPLLAFTTSHRDTPRHPDPAGPPAFPLRATPIATPPPPVAAPPAR